MELCVRFQTFVRPKRLMQHRVFMRFDWFAPIHPTAVYICMFVFFLQRINVARLSNFQHFQQIQQNQTTCFDYILERILQHINSEVMIWLWRNGAVCRWIIKSIREFCQQTLHQSTLHQWTLREITFSRTDILSIDKFDEIWVTLLTFSSGNAIWTRYT